MQALCPLGAGLIIKLILVLVIVVAPRRLLLLLRCNRHEFAALHQPLWVYRVHIYIIQGLVTAHQPLRAARLCGGGSTPR